MEYFPMFIDLEGKDVLICGGGKHALEKVQRLLPFHPKITVFAESWLPEMEEFPDINLINRRFVEGDLDIYPVFVVTGEDYDENHRIAEICRSRHVPVNAVDQQVDCDFIFPAIFHTGKLSAGICTSGASPTVAMELRRRLQAQTPDNIEQILSWLIPTRSKIFARIPEKKAQRAMLRKAVLEAFALDRPLTEDELERLMTAE